MIELKIGDLLRIKTIKDGEIQLVVVEKVDVHNKNTHNYYYASNCLWFNDDFMDDFQRYEIIAVWRFDAETGNFLKIYDNDIEERVKNSRPIKADNTKFYAESCKTVEHVNDEEKPCETAEPADVPYDKYISLQSEIAELRNVIVELNKTFYGKNNQIH